MSSSSNNGAAAAEKPPQLPLHRQLRILDAAQAHLQRDEFGVLKLCIGLQERHEPVTLRRCLPLTDPERYISVLGEDEEEIGVIPDVGALDAKSEQIAREQLDLLYLTARVERVLKVERHSGMLRWEMETDRGRRVTHTRGRNDARWMDDGRVLITDIHGAKFELPPLREMDDRSRFIVEAEL